LLRESAEAQDLKLLTDDPAIRPEELSAARGALLSYFTRYGKDEDETPFMAARYEFFLEKIRKGWRGERVYDWQIVPLGGEVERDSFSGRPRAKLYGSPPSAVPSVPDDPALAYRGMSWEEWVFIQRSGYMQSTGSHNLDQQGLTFAGPADTAEYYATGFAPVAYKPAFARPGVVVAFPRALVMEHADFPAKIPAGEYAFRGRLSSDEIVAVWYMVPTRIRYGRLEIIASDERVTDGSRSSPSAEYAVVPVQAGSDDLLRSSAEYAYHATTRSNLSSILRLGLLPQELDPEQADETGFSGGVFFYTSLEAARRFARNEVDNGIVLRFPIPIRLEGGYKAGEYITPDAVPPDVIEVI
jgi:hypothetical protein